MFCFSLTAANKRRRIFKVGACGRGYFKIGAPPFLLHPFNSSSFFFLFSNPLLSKHKINPQLCVCVCVRMYFSVLFVFGGGEEKKGMKCDGSQMRKSLQSSLSPPLFFSSTLTPFCLVLFFPSARFKLAFTMTSSRRTSACVNSIRTFPSLSIPFKKIKSYKYI